jgi:hypothetical protein
VRSHLSRCGYLLCVIGLALMGLAVPARAQTTTYSSQASFLSNVLPGYYLETFDSLTANQVLTSPLSFSANGFSYTAAAPSGFVPEAPNGSDVWLTTFDSSDPITFTFTSGNVTAVGGDFFPTDANGDLTNGNITVQLNDGTSVSLTNPKDTTFTGFTSKQTITSLTVTSDGASWASANNFIVGVAGTATTPEPGTTALLLSVGAVGLVALRRRRKA